MLSHSTILRGLLLCALFLSTGSRARPGSAENPAGTWVLHIDADGYREGIAVLQVQAGECAVRAVPTRSWSGLRADLLPVRSTTCDVERSESVWRLMLRDGRQVALRYHVVDDTLSGVLMDPSLAPGHPAEVVGVRIPASILPESSPGKASLEPSPKPGTAVVLIRLDDGFASDRDFLARLRQRDLPAELAIPTGLVAPDKLDWDDLAAWRQHGFEPVAHSRFHRGKRRRWERAETPLEFLGEVLGSLGDMARHGYATDVFVQPGSWHDSLYFDSPAKLANWHGAVFRTFTRVFEAYARPWSVPLPLADSMAQGLGHFTISNRATADEILEAWKVAQQSGRFSVFMVHTWSLQTRGQLDWFLDTLANARRAGRIRLVRSSAEVAPLQIGLSLSR